ncbi:MAG: type II toxin-antitoxin system prevent-host-death family antitoxin [Chloroflexi bacterium]|nr:type II toxin-antitoxin system prevent-host-death family antitoxin [Chloroflexota bacterium]
MMVEKIGVRELKNQTSKIVRAVREEMAEYVVTVRGEPVAILRPLQLEDSERLRREKIGEALAELDALAQEVSAAWVSEKSATETLEEMREERCQSLMQA